MTPRRRYYMRSDDYSPVIKSLVSSGMKERSACNTTTGGREDSGGGGGDQRGTQTAPRNASQCPQRLTLLCEYVGDAWLTLTFRVIELTMALSEELANPVSALTHVWGISVRAEKHAKKEISFSLSRQKYFPTALPIPDSTD